MKKIVITGGAGFIGSEVVRKFLEVDMNVIVYDNFSYGKREFLPINNRLIIVEGDINETEFLTKTISVHSPNYVCHLAAIHFIPHCNANPTKALMINTVGTESVLNACKKQNIQKVLVASTAAVYPISDLPNIEDNTEVAPIDIYGLSKMFAELLAQKFFIETGTDTIILRLFNAVGPRETNPHVIPHIFESLKTSNKIPLGNITPKRDYIHTSDIAEAIYTICNSNIKGYEVFNIGSGEEYSVEEIVLMLEEVLKRSLIIEQVEERMRKVERMHLLADISKIKKIIGWKPKIQLHDALRDICRYYGIVTE
ncbi:MAG: NAD(P)-dependent oxidoreductase [Thermodesulfobacteriota bacterium]